MTEAQATRLVCEAAMMSDVEAAHFLLRHLQTPEGREETTGTLWFAFAWVAPEEALALCPHTHSVWGWVQRLGEAHQLASETPEELEAYVAMTALLPPHSTAAEQRRRVQYFAGALRSLEEVLALPDWTRYATSVFLNARLWRDCAEPLWEKISLDIFHQIFFSVTGQFVLSSRCLPGDIPLLLDLVRINCQLFPVAYSGVHASALFKALEVLEVHAPQEIASLLPDIVRTLGKNHGEGDSILTARVLVLLAKFGLHEFTLIHPLAERIVRTQSHRISRRWVRQVAHSVRQFAPLLPQANAFPRFLRVLTLEKAIERTLTRNLRDKTPAQVRRAWRWLQKSDRVITSVADAEWRARLLKSKAHLEERVYRSRKAVHLAARSVEIR
jgi:hypothetical protein